jgi:hypothetical protein
VASWLNLGHVICVFWLRRCAAGQRATRRHWSSMTASVMHYVSFNTVAHGMTLSPRHEEMTAADFEGEQRRGG